MAFLDDPQRRFLASARSATLATIAPDGRPRLVPVCFVLMDGDASHIWFALDEKPKAVADPRELARVRDIERDPRVTLLVERWSEDWAELAWLRCDGRAELIEPGGDEDAVRALRAKYPQYATHALEQRPLVRIAVERARSWGHLG
ncbi:MAG TPA: TIGR03668 family PPOX class F420-dependent oxidoreductase [Candidatus Limnocylindrales bacterium]|nr:TIGR03668 family PPOX class F420-dependent oxidoreductase [Candidatus Limnocylindrales bacterium]